MSVPGGYPCHQHVNVELKPAHARPRREAAFPDGRQRTPATAGSSRPGRERPERSPGRLAKVLRRCVNRMIFVSTRYVGGLAHQTEVPG
jgi:hypothetical protein